jgi:hypothetical protein
VRQQAIEAMAKAMAPPKFWQLMKPQLRQQYLDQATHALDALLDALEAKQPILEAYELIEVLRGES